MKVKIIVNEYPQKIKEEHEIGAVLKEKLSIRKKQGSSHYQIYHNHHKGKYFKSLIKRWMIC
jgi:hypothetical protein